jgi:hypothetical protein
MQFVRNLRRVTFTTQPLARWKATGLQRRITAVEMEGGRASVTTHKITAFLTTVTSVMVTVLASAHFGVDQRCSRRRRVATSSLSPTRFLFTAGWSNQCLDFLNGRERKRD